MYEQVSHALLNDILDELKPEVRRQDLRHFYTRLGANFYAIHTLFSHLYGRREDFFEQITTLVDCLARAYIDRSAELERIDMAREEDHNWFLSQEIVGMALYRDAFARNLEGLQSHLPYLSELGVNMVHILPILACPQGASDGGYAVSDFRDIDRRVGTLDDLRHLADSLRKRGMLLTLDVIVNHTSNEHEWATRAKAGEREYEDFYYMFENRDMPDMFEETMPDIFPETAPGSFTWDPTLDKWVMTVFNNYQWDLNYTNPRVLSEMVDIVLFLGQPGRRHRPSRRGRFSMEEDRHNLSERAGGAPDLAADEGLLPGRCPRRVVHRRGHRRALGGHQVLWRGRRGRQGMRHRLQRDPCKRVDHQTGQRSIP